MNRPYLLFGWEIDCEPAGGARDFLGSFDSVADATEMMDHFFLTREIRGGHLATFVSPGPSGLEIRLIMVISSKDGRAVNWEWHDPVAHDRWACHGGPWPGPALTPVGQTP